jgi:hypothetical protein
MTRAETGRRNVAMASLTGILVLLDAALTAIGLLVWNAHRHGHLTGPEAATFIVVGGSAVVGAVVLLLALTALTRGARSHPTARVASALSWLRAAAVIIALTGVVIGLGVAAIAGALQTFGAAVAVADAVFGLIVTDAAMRRTRHE